MTSWSNTDLTPNQIAALQGPAPCDDCANWDRCVASDIACSDFGTYIRLGDVVVRNREPSAATFDRIHKDYERKRRR